MTMIERRTVSWVAAAALFAVASVGVLVGLAFYSHAFHRSPWQVLPTQVTACGRDYVQPDTSHPQTLDEASRSAGAALREVASTPGWVRSRTIWAHRQAGPTGAGDRCGTVVWLRVSSHRFVDYGLSGGP